MRFPLDEFIWPGKEGQFGAVRKYVTFRIIQKDKDKVKNLFKS